MDVRYIPVFKADDAEEYDLGTWSLPETIGALILIIGTYLALVLKILPSYMKNREPYKLKGLLICYNGFQVVYSSYLVILYTWYIIKHGIFTTKCPRGELLKSSLLFRCCVEASTFLGFVYYTLVKVILYKSRPIILYLWMVFAFFGLWKPNAKQIDLLDTVFFVLRKKDNQVTFLHVYHHSIMVTWAWLYYVYEPSDHFVVVGLINSFVHVLMYAYYGLASLGPRFAKFVWWKKHLTKIQLIQFILVVTDLHYQQKLTPCPIPFFFHYFCMLSIGSFFFLFMKFYLQSYVKRSKSHLNRQSSHPELSKTEIYSSPIEMKIK